MLSALTASMAFLAATSYFDVPVKPEELGLRPGNGAVLNVTPAPFVWRPLSTNAVGSYRLLYWKQGGWKNAVTVSGLVHNVYCPAETMAPGKWNWRVCGERLNGRLTTWSETRQFTIAKDAVPFPRPPDADLLARIPRTHPRLFLTADAAKVLRDGGGSDAIREVLQAMNQRCRQQLRNRRLEDLSEPPRYTDGMPSRSEAWKRRWGDNSSYVTTRLSAAAELAFGWRMTGNDAYGRKALEILRTTAKWDPKGATGYLYNDECGMPFVSFFSRAYTFLWYYLTPEDRRVFCEMMRIRGEEMYHHLFPSMFYRPYRSHGNRAWHYLNETAVVFRGEIPEAEKWLKATFDYVWCVHPVWGDEDGGWHEGAAYWASYMNRYVDWSYSLKDIIGIDFLAKPFYRRTGDFILYQEVSGFRGGGFSDCAEGTTVETFGWCMSALAANTRNGTWAWYAGKAGLGERRTPPYLRILLTKDMLPPACSPDGLPPSKLFRGSGIAVMNTCLTDAFNDVQVLFKSSPGRGTWSHGYDANNSFHLNAYGSSLFKHAGYRDCSGSPFHTRYMHRSESCNTVTAGGDTQKFSLGSVGRITRFTTTPTEDCVEGTVGDVGWEKGVVTNFVRSLRFRKTEPVTVEIRDRLQTREPTSFTWHLHTPERPFDIQGQHAVHAVSGGAVARIDFVKPSGLALSQTDEFPVPIGHGIKLVQHHLSAVSAVTNEIEFVTRIVVSRNPEKPSRKVAEE